MESRGTSTSEKKQDVKSSKPHQPTVNMAASELIQEYICPVTTEIMFEPVMISGCDHLVEGKIVSRLKKCPTCRGEEKDRGITVVAVPPIVTSILAKALAADPSLWQQVYFDLDYLEEVLRKEELKTPTGERFIKLLENNTKENLNAKPMLDEKAPDGTHKYGKSAIEILASFYAGRELLRTNEKIRSLISEKTKQLTVNRKTIAEWLAMQKEEPEAKSTVTVSARLFAGSAAPSNSAAVRAPQPQPADTVWQRVVYGKEDGALQMIRDNPHLVEEKRTVFDYSMREMDDATPFQMTLRTGDDVMAEKIKAIYLAANPDHGQEILDAQFNEVFPNGYAAHLQEQKDSADQFERDYLNPLVEAMTNASPADLQVALDKRDNGSVLCQTLSRFKTAFTELSNREKVYNPYHLLKVFEKYNAKFDSWYVNDDNPHRWLRLDLFWRQVIGWEERYMPTNYAQSFCTGLGNMVDNHQPLQRTLNLRNYDTNRDIHFFPLDADPASKLGSDFGVYSYYALVDSGIPVGVAALAYTKLVWSKNSKLGNLMQPEPRHRASHSCIIL